MTTALQEREKKNIVFCEYYENRQKFRLSLMIDATNMCQLRCSYCYYGKKGHQKMDIFKVMAAAKNLVAIFEPRTEEVNFHYMGGEPFLAWEEILELNATAQRFFEKEETKFTWSLTSNLIALDEIKTEHMIQEKAGIHCSIDGPAKIHNKNRPYRNGRPSFDTVVKNIPLALQITPNDTARVTVCPEDAMFLPEIAETILELGFKNVGLFPAHDIIWNQKSIDEWAEGIKEAHKKVFDSYQHHKEISTIVRMTQKGKNVDRFTYCGAGKGLWAIGIDGKLFFCHHLTNIPELAIIDATQNTPESIRAAIEQSILPPICEQIPAECLACPAKNYCNGGCWTGNLLNSGNSKIPEKTHCQLTQATVIAMRDLAVVNNPSACWFSDSCSCERCHPCQVCDRCHVSCDTGCQRYCESSDCYCQYMT